jgi:dynactin complex subunit
MRLSFSHAVLLLAAVCSAKAAMPGPFLQNFKVVVDNSPRNTRLVSNMRRNNSFMSSNESEGDVKTMVERIRREANEIAEKVLDEANGMVEKVQKNLQHYSKLEIGLYAALTCALTMTLKSKFEIPTLS